MNNLEEIIQEKLYRKLDSINDQIYKFKIKLLKSKIEKIIIENDYDYGMINIDSLIEEILIDVI